MKTTRWLAVLALVLGLALAGCGDDDESGSGGGGGGGSEPAADVEKFDAGTPLGAPDPPAVQRCLAGVHP